MIMFKSSKIYLMEACHLRQGDTICAGGFDIDTVKSIYCVRNTVSIVWEKSSDKVNRYAPDFIFAVITY